MKPVLLFLVTLLSMYSLAQTNSVSVKAGKEVSEDINGFVYSLPYQKGRSYLLIQAYQSKLFSHKGEYALDFKMKKGAKICAARSGVVVEVKEDSKKGGAKLKYLSEGNHVIIKHDDGTYGNYWHLKHKGALVNVGDIVKQGQVIGLAGKTGYAAFSHLHFEVTTEFTPGQHQIPTQFTTRKGKRYLKPLHWYKCI
ncbi:MAG: M23 family metallopeptidase [Flavisolibacter sp.]|nr:M23 family metallopeptidase [Flavisolibacter sp.]